MTDTFEYIPFFNDLSRLQERLEKAEHLTSQYVKQINNLSGFNFDMTFMFREIGKTQNSLRDVVNLIRHNLEHPPIQSNSLIPIQEKLEQTQLEIIDGIKSSQNIRQNLESLQEKHLGIRDQFVDLKLELQDAIDQNRLLESKNQVLESKREELEIQTRTLEENLNLRSRELQTKTADMEAQEKKCQEDIEKSVANIMQLQSELDKMNRLRDATLVTLEKTKEDMFKEFRKSIIDANVSNKKLKNETSTLKDEINRLSAELLQKESALATTLLELTQKEKDLQQKDSELLRQKASLENRSTENTDLETKLQESSDEISNLTNNLTLLQTNIKETQERFQTEKGKLQQSLVEKLNNIETISQNLESCKSKLETEEARVSELSKENISSTSEVTRLKTQIEELFSQGTQETKAANELQQQLQSVEEKLRQCNEKNDLCEIEKQRLSELQNNLQIKLDECGSRNIVLQTSLTDQVAISKDLTNTIQNYSLEKEKILKQSFEKEAIILSLQNKLNSLTTQIQQYESDFNLSPDSKETLLILIENLKQEESLCKLNLKNEMQAKSDMEAQLVKINSHIEEVEKKLNECETEKNRVREILTRCKNKVILFAKESDILKRSILDYNDNNPQVLSSERYITSEINDLRNAIVSTLVQNIITKQQNIDTLLQNNENVSSQILILTSTNSVLNNENLALKTKNSDLQSLLKLNVETANTELSNRNTELQSEIENLKTINSSLETEILTLKTTNATLISSYESLQSKNLTLSSAVQDLESKNATLESEKTQLAFEKTQLESKNAILASEKTQLESKNAILASEKTQLESEKTQLESEKTQLAFEKTQLESEKTQLESKNAILASEKTQLESEKTQLESEKTQLESEKTQLASENATLASAVQDLKFEKTQLESKNATLESEKTQLESKNATLESKKSSLETENATLSELNEKLENEKREIESMYLKLSSDIEKLIQDLANYTENELNPFKETYETTLLSNLKNILVSIIFLKIKENRQIIEELQLDLSREKRFAAEKNDEISKLSLAIFSYNVDTKPNTFEIDLNLTTIKQLRDNIVDKLVTQIQESHRSLKTFVREISELTLQIQNYSIVSESQLKQPGIFKIDFIINLKNSIVSNLVSKIEEFQQIITNVRTQIEKDEEHIRINNPLTDYSKNIEYLQITTLSCLRVYFNSEKEQVESLVVKSLQRYSWNRMCQYMYFQVLYFCAKSVVLNDRVTRIRSKIQRVSELEASAASATPLEPPSNTATAPDLGYLPGTLLSQTVQTVGSYLWRSSPQVVPENEKKEEGISITTLSLNQSLKKAEDELIKVYEQITFNTISMKAFIENFIMFTPVMEQMIKNPLHKVLFENIKEEISDVAFTNFSNSFEFVQNATVSQSFNLQYKPELVELVSNLFRTKLTNLKTPLQELTNYLSSDLLASNLSTTSLQITSPNVEPWQPINLFGTTPLFKYIISVTNLELYSLYCENELCDRQVVYELFHEKFVQELDLEKQIQILNIDQEWESIRNGADEKEPPVHSFHKKILFTAFLNYVNSHNLTISDELKGKIAERIRRGEVDPEPYNTTLLKSCKQINNSIKKLKFTEDIPRQTKFFKDNNLTDTDNVPVIVPLVSSQENYATYLQKCYYYSINNVLFRYLKEEYQHTLEISQ
jgi:chromosome segregation ATPase